MSDLVQGTGGQTNRVGRDLILLHVGLDDSDSPNGGCTTFIGERIVNEIATDVTFTDFPRLVRHDPNVPYKTRGNGSVALSFIVDKEKQDAVKNKILDVFEAHVEPATSKTNPAMVFVKNEIPRELINFSKKVMISRVTLHEAKALANKHDVEIHYHGNGRGLIGALAGIANPLPEYTFELLAYRSPSRFGTKRSLDESSVFLFDRLTRGLTFDNIDEEKNKAIILPAGKDPVLYGVRGIDPFTLKRALTLIKTREPIFSWMIYKTNQGTGQHWKLARELGNSLEPHSVVALTVKVIDKPKTTIGGHVFVKVELVDDTMDSVRTPLQVAAYEPTSKLRDVIRALIPGDIIFVEGGIREKSPEHPLTINLEQVRVLELKKHVIEKNPPCPYCGKSLKSDGKNKGFKCKKCKKKFSDLEKTREEIPRSISPGIYQPPPRSHRHLTRPLFYLENVSLPFYFRRITCNDVKWHPVLESLSKELT